MIRKILVGFFLLLLFSCQSDVLPSCFREPGATISRIDQLEPFTQISIGEGIHLVVRQDVNQEVKIETGENLMDEIQTTVENGVLKIENKMKCSLGTTIPAKAIITVPDLTKIYSSSQYNVESEGVLNFPQLSLQQGLIGKTASNIFDLNINCNHLSVENNNTTIFRIKGQTNSMAVAFYSGDSRFEGANLLVDEVLIFQRSSNDMILKPSVKIEGDIYSNGNVILLSHPPTVNVTQHYTGKLIFQ